MLIELAQTCAALAVLGNAVVYGADVVAGLVTRSVNARLDDSTVTITAGWGHYYADRRMPFAGAGGLVTAVLALVLAAVAGATAATIATVVAVAALVLWLGLYVRIAKPINTAQTQAAQSGVIPPDARALQDKWESILPYRMGLQTTAIAALCATLALL